MSSVWIGTSGYSYQDWKDRFYPRGLSSKQWLAYYAQRFSTVEVNATFYRSFPRTVFSKWASQVPDGFRFAIKGPRFITHRKKLLQTKDSVKRFFEEVMGLEHTLKVVLWQFPQSFTATTDNRKRMEDFLASLPVGVKYAFELRHQSWFEDSLSRLLKRYNATLVISDTNSFPVVSSVVNGFVYLRLHGPGTLYASRYTDEQLNQWAAKIKQFQVNGDVYVYFNNDAHGYAVENALYLQKVLV